MNTPRPTTGKSSFTLMELLVVIGIIAVVLAMLVPGLSKMRERAKIYRAQRGVQDIAAVFRAMENDYGRYPWASTPLLGRPLMNDFTWLAAGGFMWYVGNPVWWYCPFPGIDRYNSLSHVYMERNPKEMVFAPGDSWWGIIVDPWGQPYRVAIGDPLSNTVTNPFQTNVVLQLPFVVWSNGPDGTNDLAGENSALNRDNIKSY